MSTQLTIIFSLAFCAVAVGVLLAFTPYLMRRNECFAVTIPPHAQGDSRIKALKRRYVRQMVAVTAVAAATAVAAGVLLGGGTYEQLAAVAACVIACLLPVIVSFALMLHYRKKVRALKTQEGWRAERQLAAASIAEDDAPRPLSLTWNVMHFVVMLGTVALGLALYPGMPDQLPMHADLTGAVTRYVPKSLATALGFPLAVEAFMAACFILCHWIMLRSKRPTDPGAPATSAYAYGLFARAQSAFLLVAGVILNAGIGVLFMLSSAGIMELSQVGVILILLCVLVTAGALVLSVVYGQAGARVYARMQDSRPLMADEDEHWKLGVFYFNREDPSLFLPERFGIGWTMNLARPGAWAVIVGLAAVTALFIGVVTLLA